ncbi:MAG: efflux RND transporter permease subunit, partial [Pseudorhodobacter sp.]|nr:efflux RND transporter permease subunit [Pseudorhodobacter sp.]
ERAFLGDAQLGLTFCLLGIFMVLAWVFASWTRPIVVMSVIPFGLIGAIYGHDLWQVPLSMFSIVGMIGMTGIIINDSIVLVSTVDEYARKRGLFPAIIDAVCDRFRPVMLTTLTTVLGLAPLLYERSSQAEFLRPTVITLVYGLGVGMFIVLLLVPAVLAIQLDVRRQVTALRRGLRASNGQAARRARGLLIGAGLALAGLFAVTLGAVIFSGALPVWLVTLWPALEGVPPLGAALGLFTVASLALLALTYVIGRIVVRPRRARLPA